MTKDQIREYCSAEFENIDKVVASLSSVAVSGKKNHPTANLASMAVFIHNAYNGMENILKRVLLSKNVPIKDSPTWHKDVLKASLDHGIIDRRLFDAMSDYLSFRHFFVHSYVFTLKWEELKPLTVNLKGTLNDFKSAIRRAIGTETGKR